MLEGYLQLRGHLPKLLYLALHHEHIFRFQICTSVLQLHHFFFFYIYFTFNPAIDAT